MPLPLASDRPDRDRRNRRRRRAARGLALALGFVALSAHLLLPLFVVCRTYRSLTLDEPPPCCARARACAAPAPGEDVPALRAEGTRCPFCTAASPFRHAAPSPPFPLPRHTTRLVAGEELPPAVIPPTPPDLTSAAPRAPPRAS